MDQPEQAGRVGHMLQDMPADDDIGSDLRVPLPEVVTHDVDMRPGQLLRQVE